MILTAACPAPVAYVPARARHARFALARIHVPVEIREVPADALEPGPDFFPDDRFRSEPFAVHAGGLWSRATLTEERGRRPVTRDEFARFVEGRAGNAIEQSLAWSLLRTPLVACPGVPGDGQPHLPSGSRGEVLDLDGARRIDRDDRSRAVKDLHAYLFGNVLLAGERVYLRRAPLAALKEAGGRCLIDLQREGQPLGFRTMVATPASLPEVIALQERDGGRIPDPLGRGVRRWMEECPESCLEGAVPRRIVNAHAGALHQSLDRHLQSCVSTGHPAPNGMVGIRDALRELEILALTGMACRGGEEDAIDLVQRAATLCQAHNRHLDRDGRIHLAVFVREVVLPRLTRDLSADVEALAALGPTP